MKFSSEQEARDYFAPLGIEISPWEEDSFLLFKGADVIGKLVLKLDIKYEVTDA